MKRYIQLFSINLASQLQDRGIFFTWILVDLVSLATATILWLAVFRTNTTVGSYDLQKMLSYYLLVPVIRSLVDSIVIVHLPKKIKEGFISSDLMKPFNFTLANLITQTTKKLSKLTMQIPIYFGAGLIFALLYNIKFSLNNFLAALVVCGFSYILNFLIDLSVSYVAFWLDEVGPLSSLKSVAALVLGGTTFPIDLVPQKLQLIFNLLPFRLITYFPIKIAQGELTWPDFLTNFWQLLLWIIVFYILSQTLWLKGTRKYGAYGN
jgi:ABC-2 type transport system permease protein